MATDIRDLIPFHHINLGPGDILPDFLADKKWSTSDFATALGVSVAEVEALLANQTPITQELEDKLHALFQMSAGFWLRAQENYDRRKRLIAERQAQAPAY